MKTMYEIKRKNQSILIYSDDLLKQLQEGKHPKVVNTFYLADDGANDPLDLKEKL